MSREVILFTSAARIVTENSELLLDTDPHGYVGIWLYLDITASAGTTPTLDITLERYDPASATWVAIPGAAFAQKVTTGADELILHPSMTAAANTVVKEPLGGQIRAVSTIAGTSPSFTFTLGGQLLR